MLGRVLFYAGFALIALGGLSLIYPLSWLRIRTRAAALLVIAAGFLLVAIGAEMLDSYLVYLGFALFMAGLVSLIRPLRFLWIRNRWSALAIARDARATRRLTPDLFRETLPPGFVLATMNFVVEPNNHGGSTVSTETRIHANSGPALRQFGVYWRLIHPGSDIIRRMWLRAIKQRSED